MEIVFLDNGTINSNDISWAGLEKLGNLKTYAKTDPHQLIARAKDAHAVFTVRTAITREFIEAAHNLCYIGVVATGYDKVDLDAAKEYGVTVANIRSQGITAPAIAQGTFALLMELTNNVGFYTEDVASGNWGKRDIFAYADPHHKITSLSGKTIGLVGFGDIGQLVGGMAHAFGMNVIAKTQSGTLKTVNYPVTNCPSLKTLLEKADVVSLHCPLTPNTRHLINRQTLSYMKPSAFLINTARGGLIDEDALNAALHNGNIAGAALDVLSSEPPLADNPLLSAPRCSFTPHNSWMDRETRTAFLAAGIETFEAFLNGTPKNVIVQPVSPKQPPVSAPQTRFGLPPVQSVTVSKIVVSFPQPYSSGVRSHIIAQKQKGSLLTPNTNGPK
jgi:glycerate dehydrogenase